MSLINWKEKYLRKLHTTALIGYLYRTLEEYEPEQELEREKSRWSKEASTALAEDLPRLKKEHEERLRLIATTANGIVEQFLNRNFEYNPDRHLRGAHAETAGDPERADKYNKIKSSVLNEEIDDKLKSRPENLYKYTRGVLLSTYQCAVETQDVVKSVSQLLEDPTTSVEDKQGILYKKYNQLGEITTDMGKVARPLAELDTYGAFQVNPPVELSYNFDRYLTNHYEQLRDVVTAVYAEKSDIEYAVVLYDVHKTAEDAHNYRVQHKDEFRSEVFAVDNSAVNLIGPFKENRDRVEYYNKNTEVLKLMHSQLEADHKLGKDLMEKTVRREKAKTSMKWVPTIQVLLHMLNL